MTDKNFNPTSPFIPGQLPEFVRVDHPTLVSFLTAYYEWLDSDNTYLRSPKKLASVVDVDTTLEEFITYFKNEYLFGFPEKLAVSEKTSKPVDPVKLMKNIKGFYRAKGTEKTYDFLFRILFDTSVEFYYPKNDIMKLSDGKWVVRRSIKISNNIGNAIFDSVGGTVVQRNTNGDIVASARVLEVSTYRIGTNDIAELFLGGVNGQFQAGYDGIEFTDKSGVTRKENRVFSVIGKTTISNGGSGYKAGDRVIFTPATGDTGVKAAGRVAEVDASGTIRKIIIDNFGVNYKTAPTLSVQTELGSGFAGSVTVSGMAEYQGYYANNDGRLSTNKVIQDSHYYQNFSYVILSEVTIDRYRDVLKRLLNPAGLAFFGKVQIKRCAVADLQNSTSLVEYEVPIIGHYAPYTFLTYDDLSNWFTDPNTGLLAGYDPTVHNQIIRNDLDGNGSIDFGDIALSGLEGMSVKEYYDSIGNPVTFNRAFINPLVPLRTANFQNADPFWIVYQHPNRKIRGSVTARIPFDLKNEFLNDLGGLRESPFDGTSQNSGSTGYWAEWTEGSTANRIDWSTGFTSGERYVTLNYNPLKPYTQYYYEPQAEQLTTLKAQAQGRFIPEIYIENVFTYDGLKNIESIVSAGQKSFTPSSPQVLLPSGTNTGVDDFIVDASGNHYGVIETSIESNTRVPGLDPFKIQSEGETDPLLNTTTSFLKSAGNEQAPTPVAKFNKFTSWDSETSSHYVTKIGGVETGYLGVAGLTNTSKAAMDKFVGSLLGQIAGDWNGLSGANGLRLGDEVYTLDHSGLISMNTESWDPALAESVGIIDPDDPNSKGNFIMRKILIPVFVGGAGADGITFDGLQTIFPNASWGNYGHPGEINRNIRNYIAYPGFSGDARSAKFEVLTLGTGVTYRSYVPSASCPDCRWDGRVTLDSKDPNASKAGGLGILDCRAPWLDKNQKHAIKLYKEKWYEYCKAVNVWMPSFYTSTENLEQERALQWLTIQTLTEMRQQIIAETGIDNKKIIPFISNKVYTVATGSGGFGSGQARSLQDGSFYTPQEFVDNYIAPSLSGPSGGSRYVPRGTVHGFYIWTGDDTYTRKQALHLTSPNPLRIEITDSDGNVIGWKKNPLMHSYGYEPYWDFNGGEGIRPWAPTGPNVIGKNNLPRVSWYVSGNAYGGNPWWGGNHAPSWPTAQAADGSGCQRLDPRSNGAGKRQNILALQAFFDGMTGQTGAQFVFDKPEKYGYLQTTYPTFFQKGTNLPEWGRTKGYVYKVRKTSNDGKFTIPIGMTPGTTFAFNYRNVKSGRPIRQRASKGITGDIISNPLFNSLTGSSTVFSYPDGNSYKDLGWNTADRIGYVKAVRDVDANTVEVEVEPFFFVGVPQFTQASGSDQSIWSPSPLIVDGITCGITSGNGVSNLGVTGPHETHAFLVTKGYQVDPSTTAQRPKWTNLGFAGDIISFGAVGATFELVDQVRVTGDYQRTTGGEVDRVYELIDKLYQQQIEAAVNYWDGIYNPAQTTDFAFDYDSFSDAWFAYGPGGRIIINGWTPEKPGILDCSNSILKPQVNVISNDVNGTLDITYTYSNLCGSAKIMEWPDLPSLNLGDSIEYYDSSVSGVSGSDTGKYKPLTRNQSPTVAAYPGNLYSPVHLAKTKFTGSCCEENNFAVGVSLLDYSPIDDNHAVSLVAYPPQDFPAVALRTTSFDVVNDQNFVSKITPTGVTQSSKWAAAWTTPTYGNGPTGSTHITSMFAITGRLSASPQFDEAITGATSAKNFLSTIPPNRRVIQPRFLGAALADNYWLGQGITLDNTYNTGDACRDSLGNFVTEDLNDPREIAGKTGAYGGTQRFISPWFDNASTRAKASWDTWLSEYLSIGGSAQHFILDDESYPTSVWGNFLRKSTSDTTTKQFVTHMNYILSDPRADSLTAGNAGSYGSLKTQLKLDAGYTTSQFSNIELAMGASGGYKLWNSVVNGLASYYIDNYFTSPITSRYPNAKISNYDGIRLDEQDYVSDLNGHKEYSNTTIGNSVAPYLYGEIVAAGTAYQVYSQDARRLDYSPTPTPPFGITPWNGLLLSQQKLRAADRNRISDNKSLNAWIASVKYYGSNAFGGNVNLHNEYWRENVYHTMMHNPDLLLYWNTSSTVAADDKYFHDAIDAVNNITNQKIYNTLTISNDKLEYNTDFVVSGCLSANQNQNIFRVSVNKTNVNIIDIDGIKTTLGTSETGIWLTTRQECKTLTKSNYDSLTKTLFLTTNTTLANTRYKAYNDRYSFQYATCSESQLVSPALISAGETKTYRVSIKFNKIPAVGGNKLVSSLAVDLDNDILQNAAAFETLSPYKSHLDSKYPQSYVADYRPVKGINLAYTAFLNLTSPTASSFNPYGWDKTTVKYAQAGGYPNDVGYTGVVSYVKNQLEVKGWDRVMVWLPSGAAYTGGNYIGEPRVTAAAYPVRAVSHWTESNQIITLSGGATYSVNNNMDDASTLMKQMVDALDDDKRVGFWFGNSPYYQTGFGGTFYPMGSTGYDEQLLFDQLDIVENITTNDRGVEKGMIGLDSWNGSYASNRVSPKLLELYRNSILSIYPNKYVTEGRNPDYSHRKDATYIDLFASNGERNVKGSFGIANYLSPENETWVGCNWYSSTDPALLGFGGDPTRVVERDTARGAIVKELVDMGYVPVVFDELDRAYIFGGEPGPTACTGCDCCQPGCFNLLGIYDCVGCSGCQSCTGCPPPIGATCSGANCCGTTANGNECWNTFLGVFDCEGCSGFGGCTGCTSAPQDPCISCHPGIPCLNIMTGLLDCEGCSGCFGCTGCGITAPATGCALCSSITPCFTVDGIYDCAGCSGCHSCTGCPQGPTGATGCNLCRSDAPCWTLAGIYDCEGCSGCFGCLGCTTTTPCIGCECCTGGCFNKSTNLYDCEGCSGCFGCTGCGITGVSAGATACTGSGGTACCGTTGSGTLCYNIVTGLYDCAGCSGFNGCTGCGITGSLTGCALCSQENPCFTVDGFYDCQGCSGCYGCLGCSITGATSCTGCGCCSTSTTGGCYNIVTGLYDCEGCSGCFSCTGCPVTGGCIGCDCCMTGGYNRITGLKDCEGCSGCFGFTGCGITAPATGCARCSEVNACYTMDIPTAYDCEGCSGCWQCLGCPATGSTCSDGQCCGSGALKCYNTYTGLYDCLGCSGFGGCTGCAVTGASAGPTGCAACSTWEGLPCYNIVTGLYDCAGCSGCHSCTGCPPVIVEPGCTGCSCCSPIFDCFTITGAFDCAGCSGCYNCQGCKQRYTRCTQCKPEDCTVGELNYDFCVDCGCGTQYTNCDECTQIDCDTITVNTKFCRNTCGCVPTSVLCDECVKNNCNGVGCKTECDECIYDGPGKYTNCNQCLQGDCDFPSSINYEFCISCGCRERYTLCSQCTQSDCDDQFGVNNQFCIDCGCTASINCAACVAGNCVGENCDACIECSTEEEYTNCGQCLPADCTYDYRVNHTYCVETCGCIPGGTGGETGNEPPIAALTTLGSRVAYSDFRKITLRSFLTMPVGPEFDCKNQDVQAPPVPQVKVTSINGTFVDSPEWSTDTNFVVYSEPGSRSIAFNVEGVSIETGNSAGLSTLLYLSYYSAISLWADLYVVDQTGKEYQMASTGPFPTSASSIRILYPFINPNNPNTEPGAITLGRGIFGSPFQFRGVEYPNTNCIYRVKLYFRNVSNAIIPGSETIKEFNYELT